MTTRRRFLTVSAASLALQSKWLAASASAAPQSDLSPTAGRVVTQDNSAQANQVALTLHQSGDLYRAQLENHGTSPVRIKEVVLFSLHHNFPPETQLYGEGFTMLSQTTGTLANPKSSSIYLDAVHYKLPQPPGAKTYYGLIMLSPPQQPRMLVAFTSCHRFSGKFDLRDGALDVVVDADGVAINPGEVWKLEEVLLARGESREELLGQLTHRLVENHPPRHFAQPPAGWCSWYMQAGAAGIVGANVTAEEVKTNLGFIQKNLPGLKYLQIDDGYEPYDGDWLETGAAFGGRVQDVLQTIREEGFQPAIWVAPFVAEEKSRLFRDHPGWFIQDDSGKPLRSDRVTFGGWHGPWYALDGTHPEAQKYLEMVFRTMKEKWGCQYFKLDANFWGAMQGGHHHDPTKTRVEAYRLGMEAIWRGAGEGAYLLGCNHPLWPSLGLISGSRSSNDTSREWKSFAENALETLTRNWQNGVLWWNDPDCVLLTGNLPENEYLFHASAALASGGAILSGDNLPDIPDARLQILRKLLPPSGLAAKFDEQDLRVGRLTKEKEIMVFLFNREDDPREISFFQETRASSSDYWSGAALGIKERGKVTMEVPGRSAKVLVLKES